MGRGEDFFIYQGYSRTIGFGFRVAVENPKDLVPLYNKLNALASQVYPDYSQGGVMRTSVTRVTVGDYLYRVPGFIESVNITVNQDSSWEINDGYQLPHYLDVQIAFKPIHETMPTRVTGNNIPNSIIYNRRDVSESGPNQLNDDFYKKEARDLTQKEIRRINRKEKRDNNRIKREEARKDRREQRQQEKAAKMVPPSYF
jgi:hypothetical protein